MNSREEIYFEDVHCCECTKLLPHNISDASHLNSQLEKADNHIMFYVCDCILRDASSIAVHMCEANVLVILLYHFQIMCQFKDTLFTT